MIWVEAGDNSTDGVVEDEWTHSNFLAEDKVMTFVKERFVFPHGLSLVVEYCPSSSDPTTTRRRSSIFFDRNRLCLNLLLYLTAQTVVIDEMDLGLQLTGQWRICMCLTRNC